MSLLLTTARRHGHGVFQCAGDGYRFEGEWEDGRKHGQGVMYVPNGDRFSGQWENGKLASAVTYTFPQESPWANPDF